MSCPYFSKIAISPCLCPCPCNIAPKALTFKNKLLPNVQFMEIMFEGTIATGKNVFCTSGEIPKECTKGSEDSTNSKEFVDPQCQPSANVDTIDVESPSLSREKLAVNKGKGLASDVHIFKGIYKKPKKKAFNCARDV